MYVSEMLLLTTNMLYVLFCRLCLSPFSPLFSPFFILLPYSLFILPSFFFFFLLPAPFFLLPSSFCRAFFVENILEELDVVGEWYQDVQNNKL